MVEILSRVDKYAQQRQHHRNNQKGHRNPIHEFKSSEELQLKLRQGHLVKDICQTVPVEAERCR